MNCYTCGEDTTDSEYVITYYIGDKVSRVQHEGCRQKAQIAEFESSGRLVLSLVLDAQLRTMRAGPHKVGVDDHICDAVERLKEDARRFDIEAWFGGVPSVLEDHRVFGKRLIYPRSADSLQSVVESARHNIRARLDDIAVLAGEFAGRACIDLETDGARIGLITAAREQTARMGINTIDGTEEQCRRLINTVRERWRELKFEPCEGRS